MYFFPLGFLLSFFIICVMMLICVSVIIFKRIGLLSFRSSVKDEKSSVFEEDNIDCSSKRKGNR